MMPSVHRWWQWLAQAEHTLKFLAGDLEMVQRELQALETYDRSAVTFDRGELTIPVRAAEVTAHDQGVVLDPLHEAQHCNASALKVTPAPARGAGARAIDQLDTVAARD